MSTLPQADPLLTPAQTAKILGVQTGTLQQWRTHQRYPLAYVKSGRLVRYRQSAIDAFVELQTVTPIAVNRGAA